MFLEQIKNAILTSKQLEVKSESFSKLNRYFGKEIDDFSFKVEDTIELKLNVKDKTYSVDCLASDRNLDDDLYSFVVTEALKEVDFPSSTKEYAFNLGLNVKYDLYFEFVIELKHTYNVEGFALKKLHKSRIVSVNKFQKDLNQIRYNVSSDNDCEILGYASKEKTSGVLVKLKEDQKYFFDLINTYKSEISHLITTIHCPNYYTPVKLMTLIPVEDDCLIKVNEMFRQFNEDLENKTHLKELNSLLNMNLSSYKELLDLDKKTIVTRWLDKNCKSEFRHLIDVTKDLSLEPIDFLNSKCEAWFEGCKVAE